jgi:hypothetical protein
MMNIHERSTTMDRVWLTRQEAADFLSIAPKTLANWCSIGTGPDLRRIGRGVRYHRDELSRFVESNGSAPRPPRRRAARARHRT